MSLGQHLYCLVDVLFVWFIDKLMDGLLESLDAWWSSSDANWDIIIDKQANFHISIHFLQTLPLRLEPLLCRQVCVCCWRFLLFYCCNYNTLPTSNNKVEVKSGVRPDVWVFEKHSLRVSVSSSFFSRCALKSFKVLLECDTDNGEQLYAFCIWLKTVPCSMYILYPGDDEYVSSPLLFLTTEDLFMAAWLKREESKRVCGFVDMCQSVLLLYSISGN